ncbi:hypothetical protein F8388_000794 [Cannabis sativa]|uniref:Uncharacterized protein n=1 Tax=Cannabis sativa TaxID=3483 RepID=A0A7J6F0A1_CANSA|nr:hypothetical protein F8388_000794 [Cannabis sativa]KAF4364026.1 hypothetical protein G4B88_014983 [Cannabis sativa]
MVQWRFTVANGRTMAEKTPRRGLWQRREEEEEEEKSEWGGVLLSDLDMEISKSTMKNNEEDNDEILAKLEKAKDPLRVRNDDIVLASCPKSDGEFLGFPFSTEEENNRVVPQEIQELCSFDNLKNLE